MYTLLLNETNEFITTVKERIMQRSKLVDNLHFLVEPSYKGLDMSDFTVMLEYVLPISKEYKSEILVKSDELYKNYLEYKLPFDTCLTKEHGKIEVQLTFIKVDLDEEGNSIQRVRKTSKATITIVPIAAWSDVIADSALSALDQRLIQTEAMINQLNEISMYLDNTKADNIVYDTETQTLQLTSNGDLIGDSVNIGYIGTSVISIEVDEDGNMIVNYSDGRSENIGAVGECDKCPGGVYIPSYSEDGILTFTRKDRVEEEKYEWDIDKSNDWIPIDSVEQDSTYIWQEL